MSIRRLFLISLLFFAGITGYSQQYNLKVYGTRDGLANSIVKAIYMDSKGYLWFGTQGGLSRFDGQTFVNYSDKDGLPGNDITCVTEDKLGNIWIGTYGFGIAKFDGQKFTAYDDKTGLSDNTVYNILCDDQGILWITTFNGGINKYDGKTFTAFGTKTGLLTDQFLKCGQGRGGNIWFGTKGKGVYRYDGTNFVNYGTSDSLASPSYYCAYTDTKGQTWFGSLKNGIDVVNSDYRFSHLDLPEVEGGLISSIIEDRRGNMWIAGKKGLLKYNSRERMLFTENHGLPSNSIYAICEDYEGNIWVGTSGGVCLFRNEAFVTYTEKEGLTKSKVTAYFNDSKGNCFVGMYGGGVGLLKDNTITPLSIKELDGQLVMAFSEDASGQIWVGCEGNINGVVIIAQKGETWGLVKVIPVIEGRGLKTIPRIIRDRNNCMWVASYGAGAVCFKPDGSYSLYRDSLNLPSGNVLTVFEDETGNIWLGMYQAGIAKIDMSGTVTLLNEDDGLGDNSVWCITQSPTGEMLFGTNDNGISIYNGSTFTSINTSHGLCSDLVYALVIDKENRIWAGTNKGVNRISAGNNFTVAAVKYFGEKEGLRGTEVSQHCLYIDSKNLLWIGTENGLIRYNPIFDYVNDNPPKLQLNTIRLNYENVDWTKYVDSVDTRTLLPVNPVLSFRDNHLTFDFQALTTDFVQYQFMLEGLDDKWSPWTSNTSASYPNIPSGRTYTFRLKAVNSDGFESKDVISYTFTIEPPFWETWWFYTLCVIVVLIAVVSFIRWRTSRLQKEKKVLEEKVEERTQELSLANTQLSVAYNDITDSINYAKRIQQAMLPPSSEIRKVLPDHFIFFKPRDIVSGDFYWFFQKENRTYIAAIDCTGHGVPGAFMSIIGNSLLNEIMNETDLLDPASIMNLLREKLIVALRQQGTDAESKDGMDMVLCCIDRAKNIVTFAGANNPLYHFSGTGFTEYKGDKMPIGVYAGTDRSFTNKEIPLVKGDVIYLITDGYPDQFGGPAGKKFLYTRFKQFLAEITNSQMNSQQNSISSRFDEWKGMNDQVDDVLVIGIRL
jgi:ligand-binding sensor domain-containing protein/serine phosphatase RsbU (regulator of sigma subunit)